ncbi:MAG: hypothetical protein WCO84_01135 [bacterium]
MQIVAKKYILENCPEYGQSCSYKLVKFENCCGYLTSNKSFVLTNNRDFIYNENYTLVFFSKKNYDYKLDILYGVFLQETNYDYEGIIDDSTYHLINYCPFCGKEIEIIIEETIDKREEVKLLNDSLKLLYKQRDDTDSIANRRKLDKEIDALKSEIYDLDNSDGWGEYCKNDNY